MGSTHQFFTPTTRKMLVGVVFSCLILGVVQGSNVYRTTEPGTLAYSYLPGRYYGYASPGYSRTGYSDGGYGTLAPSYLKENEVQYPSLYYQGHVSHGYYPSHVSHGYYPRTGYSDGGYGTLAPSYLKENEVS